MRLRSELQVTHLQPPIFALEAKIGLQPKFENALYQRYLKAVKWFLPPQQGRQSRLNKLHETHSAIQMPDPGESG